MEDFIKAVKIECIKQNIIFNEDLKSEAECWFDEDWDKETMEYCAKDLVEDGDWEEII